MKVKNAIGFTHQNEAGRWKAVLMCSSGKVETWNHETRTEAEEVAEHHGSKLGWKRIGDWRRP